MIATKRSSMSKRKTLAIYIRDGGLCGFCGLPVNADDVTIDHIQPLALGGPNEMANLRLAHGKCNTNRGIPYVVTARRNPAPYNPEAKTISAWRTERGMTQQQLADAIGVKMQQVSQWETNRRGIAARRLQDVARALGVSMDAIELPADATARGKRTAPEEDAPDGT